MSDSDETTVFDSVGEAVLRRFVAAFYQRVPQDDVLGPMYPPSELASAERRLADFLIYRFGGPDTYLSERGNPQLRMRHMPFAITGEARDRWVSLMDAALDEIRLPPGAAASVQSFLHDAATFLINRQ